MKFAAFEDLNTRRLRLRKLRLSDAACYYERLGSSRDVTKYMLWQPHTSLQESEESIRKALAGYEVRRAYTWAIALPEDDSVIGRIDLLRFDEAQGCCSFAYMLGKDYWGQGFGTEVLRAVFAFAFDKMEMKTIVADHMSENAGSGKVMQKAGMHFVAKHNAKYEKAGKQYDAEEYRITLDDWKQMK